MVKNNAQQTKFRKINRATYNSIRFLAAARSKHLMPVLEKTKEDVGEKRKKSCDATLIYFNRWVKNRDKDTGARIHKALIMNDMNEIYEMLVDYGYYIYARRNKHISKYGIVDETDYVYQ